MTNKHPVYLITLCFPSLFIACGETTTFEAGEPIALSNAQSEDAIPSETSDDVSPDVVPDTGSNEIDVEIVVPENESQNTDQNSENSESEPVEEVCGSGNEKVFSERVIFSDLSDQVSTCAWGIDENLSPLQGFFRAQLVQNHKIEIEDLNTVCEFSFDFPSQDTQFDDEIFLLVDENIVMSSKNYNQHFSSVDSGKVKFNWLELRDQVYDASAVPEPYCFGQEVGSVCEVPTTEILGPVSASFPESVLNGFLVEGKNSFDLSLVTTGDNDDSDCLHSEVYLDIRVVYD